MSKQVIPGVVRSKNLADDYKWYPLGRYELPPKEPPVTIIAAMKESDSAILLACDSEGFEAGNIRMGTGNKLQKHPSAPLAWGTAGNTTLGMEEGMEDFGDWLKNFPWPPQSLHTFRDQAAEASAKMNGRQRELARLSGRNVGEASTIDCLIVGWMGGPFIYELNDKGEVSSTQFRAFMR